MKWVLATWPQDPFWKGSWSTFMEKYKGVQGYLAQVYWNGNVVSLKKFSSLSTIGAVSDDNWVKLTTFPSQCYRDMAGCQQVSVDAYLSEHGVYWPGCLLHMPLEKVNFEIKSLCNMMRDCSLTNAGRNSLHWSLEQMATILQMKFSKF